MKQKTYAALFVVLLCLVGIEYAEAATVWGHCTWCGGSMSIKGYNDYCDTCERNNGGCTGTFVSTYVSKGNGTHTAKTACSKCGVCPDGENVEGCDTTRSLSKCTYTYRCKYCTYSRQEIEHQRITTPRAKDSECHGIYCATCTEWQSTESHIDVNSDGWCDSCDWVLGSPKKLSEYAEGQVIYLKESGVLEPWYVGCHNYAAELNGEGKTLLLRKEFADERVWSSSNSRDYAGSDVDVWLDTTYKSRFEEHIQELMGVKFWYAWPDLDNHDSTDITIVKELERFIFLPSMYELGISNVPYCKGCKENYRLASVASQKLTERYYTRSILTLDSGYVMVGPDGGNNRVFTTEIPYNSSDYYYYCPSTDARPVRPVLALPDTIVLGYDGTVTIPEIFSVTVPTTLAISIDGVGNTYTSTASITNSSTGAVQITAIDVQALNGWTIVPYNTNMANEKVNSKLIGLKLNDDLPTPWQITEGDSLALTYDAVISATSVAFANEDVLRVIFVVEWIN